jgi:hypothetical protein
LDEKDFLVEGKEAIFKEELRETLHQNAVQD